MANSASINVNANGLNDILASLIAMQASMKEVTKAAKAMHNQINAPANPNGAGGGNAGGGSGANAGAAERLRRESNTSTRTLTDNARRESMAFVSAYAEIASSVFALTAAFNALKSAAQFGVMLTAQDNFTRATGSNLQSVAKMLQQTTRYAIDFQQAAQFSSIGRLAGFTSDQIKKLAQAGTSAATILGRDVPEALSRMFRGVAKGEPEILDELGIFIRLDKAYKEYVKTIAKGQKVLDLTAYQRVQATYYAAIKSARQMSEGNSNAKIDDFTIAAAQLSTSFKTAMLSVTDVLGPVIRFLTQNTGLLVATIAVLGSKVFTNLGNILFNVTAAKTAQAAILAKQNENRANMATNLGKAAGGGSSLIANTLISAQKDRANQLKETERVSKLQVANALKTFLIQKAGDKLAAGTMTQQAYDNRVNAINRYKVSTAVSMSEKINDKVTSGATNPSAVTAGERAIARAYQNSLLVSSRALNASLLVTATETARLNALNVSTYTRMAALMNLAGGAAKGLGLAILGVAASVKTLGISAIAALGSVASAASILYMTYSAGRAVLEYFGAFGKGIKDAEDALVNAGKQSSKTLEGFNKLSKLPITDSTGAIAYAKISSNVYGSLASDLDVVNDKLRDVRESGNWGTLDVKLGANIVSNVAKTLSQTDKNSIMERVKAIYIEEAKVANTTLADDSKLSSEKDVAYKRLQNVTGLNFDNATSSMEGFVAALSSGKAPSLALKAAGISLKDIMDKNATSANGWTGALEGTVTSLSNLETSIGNIAKTMKAESIFNEPTERFRTLKNDVVQLSKEFSRATFVKITPNNLSEISRQVEAQLSVLNSVNRALGKKELDLLGPTTLDNAEERINLLTKESAITANIAEAASNKANKERNKDLARSKALESELSGITLLGKKYADLGMDISSATDYMSKFAKAESDKNAAQQKIKYIKDNNGLLDGSSNDGKIAVKDAQDTISDIKQLQAKDLALFEATVKTKAQNIINDAMRIPITVGSTKSLDEALSKLAKGDKDGKGGVSKEGLKNAKIAYNNVASLQATIDGATISTKGLGDLISETKSNYADIVPTSTLDAIANVKKLAEDTSYAQLTAEEKLALQTDKYIKSLQAKYTNIKLVASAYSYETAMLGIYNEEMLTLSNQAKDTKNILSNVFSGMSFDLAEKIAGMEGKLRDAAVSNANKTVDSIIVELKNKDSKLVDMSPAEQEIKDISLKLYDMLNGVGYSTEEYTALLAKQQAAEQKLRTQFVTTELTKADSYKLDKARLAEQNKLIKENKWSTMMIESAKQVTSAWEDAKMAIARGMGTDGKSIADSIKDSLGKGTQGIQDYIGAKLGKKQAVAFDALENKAKDYFLGSKDKDGKRQDGIFKSLGDKFTSAFPKLGKVGGFLGDAGGLDALKGILSKDAGQRNAAIGGALGSVAGKSIGMAFGAIGGPLGMAVGSVLGNIVGSVFSKKLKETGVLTKVSELGIVSANSIEIFKKTGLSGTKTIESVGNSLEAEAVSALQNAVTTTRKSYESNILSLNSMTNNVFGLTTKSLNKAFSSKYLQAAGGGKSESDLLKDFIKDYGDFLGGDQVGFLSQFKDITESLTDVLARLVTTLKVTDATFKSAFGKGTGLIGNLVPSYSKAFIKDEGAAVADRAIDKIEDIAYLVRANAKTLYTDREGTGLIDSITKHIQNMYGSIYVPPATIPNGGDGGYIRAFSQSKPIPGGSTTSSASTTASQAAKLPGYFEELLGSGFLYDANDNMQKVLILVEKYINGTISAGEKAKLVTLAALDFTDRIVKTFDGENIAAKTEAYNKAMSGYANMVSSSIIVTSGQVSTLLAGMQDVSSTILPPGLQVIKNGLLVPIQEFNTEMKNAIESGVSPEKIAEGIKLGSKLSEVINGVLETFSSINLSDLKGASDLSTSVNTAIMSTFKSSATDSFKKSLLAPLLVDLTTSIDKASIGDSSGFVSSMKNYALSGDIVTNQAKNMVQALSDPAFKSAMDSVSIEFEKLMKVFDSANSSEIMSSLSKSILDIEKTLKESAYSFAVSGDAYSVALFKAKEAFKAAGISSDYATQPIGSVIAKMKQLASTGLITTTNIDAVNDALSAMADASIAARDQIQSTVEASQSSIDAANTFMTSLTKSIIDDSGSIEAAKSSLTALLDIASSKVDKARLDYAKARASGNLLLANQAAENLTSTLDSYVNQQIDANNTLKGMAEDRYNAEKTALDNVKTIISDIANFVKDLKFDDKLSILKPIDRLTEAASNFDNLRAKVLLDSANGQLTPEAVKTLQDESKRLLDLGRDVYSSGAAYTDLYSKVMAAMATVDSRAQADVITKEASTKLYQDMALAYAKDNRDIQVDALSQLKILTKASAVDNAIAVDMINALKYNQGLPQSVTLNDYYKQLFSDAQGGGTIFTQPNVGYQDFKNVGTYDESNKVAQEATNAKLNLVLETLTTVLQNLPVNVKSAIQSSTTPTVNRN